MPFGQSRVGVLIKNHGTVNAVREKDVGVGSALQTLVDNVTIKNESPIAHSQCHGTSRTGSTVIDVIFDCGTFEFARSATTTRAGRL
jgi:hypothetical protein